MFVTEQIIAAHALAREDGFRAADDCSVAQHAGIRVQIVDSGAYNFKITTQDDLALAELLLVSREY